MTSFSDIYVPTIIGTDFFFSSEISSALKNLSLDTTKIVTTVKTATFRKIKNV